MSSLVVLGFADEASADAFISKVETMEANDIVELEDAAIGHDAILGLVQLVDLGLADLVKDGHPLVIGIREALTLTVELEKGLPVVASRVDRC